MAKTVNIRVSDPNPLTGNPFQWGKSPRLEPAIHFYQVEDDDNSDSGDESVIQVKIEKSGAATKQYLKRLTLSVIKSCYHNIPRVLRVLHKITIGVFEHLGIITCRIIYQSWMYAEQVLKGPALTKFSNDVLSWK